MRGKNIFNEIKQVVSARAAGERYGLHPDRTGMVRCPFHPDKKPSMKLDERFHCFGCGADGDAVDLTARLFRLSLKDAVKKLITDFSLRDLDPKDEERHDAVEKSDRRSGIPAPRQSETQDPSLMKEQFDQWAAWACSVLLKYLWQLRRWKEQYAPRGPSEEWHPLFYEALMNESIVSYRLDILMGGSKTEQIQLFLDIGKEVKKIEKRLGRR